MHSQFIADKFQQSPTLEIIWSPYWSSKMGENRHHSPFSLTSRSSSFESVGESIDALEIVTPRTYSHSPSPIPHSSTGGVAEFQPWLYQLFPDSYVDDSACLLPQPGGARYVPEAAANMIYPGPTSSSSVGHVQPVLNTTASDENIFTSTASMCPFFLLEVIIGQRELLNSNDSQVFIMQKRPFFKALEILMGPRISRGIQSDGLFSGFKLTLMGIRRPTGVGFSPFSEYDSSSSECDRGNTPPLSDYSPQFPSRSRANSARSSPAPPSLSPELCSSSVSARAGNPSSYSHLGATFAVPKRRKSRRKLGPDERKEVHQLRKMGACTRCWGLKMKVCNLGRIWHLRKLS